MKPKTMLVVKHLRKQGVKTHTAMKGHIDCIRSLEKASFYFDYTKYRVDPTHPNTEPYIPVMA